MNRQKLEKYVADLNQLIQLLGESSFSTRVRRWAGQWLLEDDGEEPGRGRRYRYQQELGQLAQEAVANPAKLDKGTIEWLCGPEAQKAMEFFSQLGQHDTGKKWLAKMQELGRTDTGAYAFASYCSGQKIHDPKIVDLIDSLYGQGVLHPYAVLWATSYLPADRRSVERATELLDAGQVTPDHVRGALMGGRWMEPLSDEEFCVLVTAIARPDFSGVAAAIDMVGMWRHLGRSLTGGLAELCWRALEAKRPIARHGDAWHYDELAAKLFAQDPVRGLKLTEDLLRTDHKEECWNPVDQFQQRSAWEALIRADRRKALTMLFRLCLDTDALSFRLSWDLQEILDQVEDGGLLMEFSDQDEKMAEIISRSLTAARPGFWPIAVHLLERYPENEDVLAYLSSGIEHVGSMIKGEHSVHLGRCRQDILQVVNDPSTPPRARAWLTRLAEKYREVVRKEVLREIEDDVNGFRTHLEGDNQELRDWAIQRLLDLLGRDECVKVVGEEVIRQALPRLEPPPDAKL